MVLRCKECSIEITEEEAYENEKQCKKCVIKYGIGSMASCLGGK